MTKVRTSALATPERMHQVGLELQRMKPAFERLPFTHTLRREFMSLASILPMKHDGHIYALHADLIADCARRIIETTKTGLKAKAKACKK